MKNTNLNLNELDTSIYTKKMDKYVTKWGFIGTSFRGFAGTILKKHHLRLKTVGGCCVVKYKILKFIYQLLPNSNVNVNKYTIKFQDLKAQLINDYLQANN